MRTEKGRPLVSVLMPVRNGAATTLHAVASIQAQTFTAWELIIVDDGSTDGTGPLLIEAARKDCRIQVLTRAPAGIVPALNAGLAMAHGEFIARMDADDFSYPDRLAAQVAFLCAPANHDVGLVSCLVEFGGIPTLAAGYALHVEWINTLIDAEDIRLNRFIDSPFAHPSVMFRSDVVRRFGGYQAGDYPEDFELWLRWQDAGVRMAKVPRVLLTWNDPPGRMSRTDQRYEPDAFYRVKAPWIVRELMQRDQGDLMPKPIFVWGAGRHTRKRAGRLEQHGLRVAGYIDVDVKKISPALGGAGLPVIAVEALPPAGEIFVLSYVSTRGARDYNRVQLRARGYVEGRDFLMCA